MASTAARLKLPSDSITLRTYADLDLYLSKFASGKLDLVLLLGRPGTGKTEGVKMILGISATNGDGFPSDGSVLYIEGHARPYGLYQQLFNSRGHPVVLDDLDRLYADADCIRLLKPLCNGSRAKRISWLTNATLGSTNVPSAFVTTSTVLLIANEWRSLNANVRALEDRAIILHFDPSNAEVHRRVSGWFDDVEVYEFIGSHLPHIDEISMRHYEKGRRLRRAGISEWKTTLLQMMVNDEDVGVVASLQADPGACSEKDRVERFVAATGKSRATYYRVKRRLKLMPHGRVGRAGDS